VVMWRNRRGSVRPVDSESKTSEEVLNSCFHFRRRLIPQHVLIVGAFRRADRGQAGYVH
jgi:hypothetical protein